MKNTLLLFVSLLSVCLYSTGYSQSAKEMLAEIEGKYQLDDNGNVSYVRIVEVPGLAKDEIYQRALNYFIYNYGSASSVIQSQDKDAGIIVGKGLYDNVHTGISIITTVVDAWHILRVDTKDGKARLIITLTQYDQAVHGGNTPPNRFTSRIEQEYPINQKGGSKTVMTKAFYKTQKKAIATLDGMEKAIREGNTSKSVEAEKW